jgi:hypothetical protein
MCPLPIAIEQENKCNVLAGAADGKPVAYFNAVYQAFQAAAQTVGGFVDRFYSIGGYIIRLRFAGTALIPHLTPALEHLVAMPDAAPALTICLWDGASTHVNLPPSPWRGDAYIARGEIQGCNDDRINMAYQYGANAFSMLDAAQDLAIYCIRDACQVPYYEKGAPLRTILHWWMSNHARQLVHAAAVGTPMGSVLIGGKSGSGKSTTALACLNSELFYIGDDYVLLGAEPTPFVYSLYNSAKLNADHVHRLPYLVPKISNPGRLDTEKALVILKDHYPQKVLSGLPVRAVLLPRVTGLPETKLKKVSSAMGLAALAPSTIFQLPRAGDGAFQYLARFVKQVPCYSLEVGTDLLQIPDVISGLLTED